MPSAGAAAAGLAASNASNAAAGGRFMVEEVVEDDGAVFDDDDAEFMNKGGLKAKGKKGPKRKEKVGVGGAVGWALPERQTGRVAG